MTLRTKFPVIFKINRMLPLHGVVNVTERHFIQCPLFKNIMAVVTVFRDLFPVGSFVLVVVATEAAV